MAFTAKSRAFEEKRREAKKAVEAVRSLMTRTCSKCEQPGSKRRLFDLPDGLVCLKCIPDGMTGLEVIAAEEEYKARLEVERNKPKPENYGGWA